MHIFLFFFFFQRFRFKTRRRRHVTEENVGRGNLAYSQRRRLFDMGLSQNVQQPDVNIDPEGHSLTSDNANEGPDNLPLSGAIVSQSEVLDSIEMVYYKRPLTFSSSVILATKTWAGLTSNASLSNIKILSF